MIRIFCGPYRALGPCRPSCDILVTFSGPTGPGGCLGPPGTHWQCPSTCCGQLLGFDLLGGCGRPTQPTEAMDVATCQLAGAHRRLFSGHKRKKKKRKAPPARHCMCQMSDLWHCASRNHPKATHMCPPYLNHHSIFFCRYDALAPPLGILLHSTRNRPLDTGPLLSSGKST